jgi:hypothetical protein
MIIDILLLEYYGLEQNIQLNNLENSNNTIYLKINYQF